MKRIYRSIAALALAAGGMLAAPAAIAGLGSQATTPVAQGAGMAPDGKASAGPHPAGISDQGASGNLSSFQHVGPVGTGGPAGISDQASSQNLTSYLPVSSSDCTKAGGRIVKREGRDVCLAPSRATGHASGVGAQPAK